MASSHCASPAAARVVFAHNTVCPLCAGAAFQRPEMCGKRVVHRNATSSTARHCLDSVRGEAGSERSPAEQQRMHGPVALAKPKKAPPIAIMRMLHAARASEHLLPTTLMKCLRWRVRGHSGGVWCLVAPKSSQISACVVRCQRGICQTVPRELKWVVGNAQGQSGTCRPPRWCSWLASCFPSFHRRVGGKAHTPGA